MEVSGQVHTPTASSRGKKLLIFTAYETERLPQTVWTLWSRGKHLDPVGN
jgi:hypothetical protein